MRPLIIGGAARLSFIYREPTRDLTKNLDLAAGLEILDGLIGNAFAHAHLATAAEELQ